MEEKIKFFEKEHFRRLRADEGVEIDLERVYDWYFGNYLKSGYIRTFRNRKALKILREHVKGNFVLEYGCGSGDLALLLGEIFGKSVGFDFSEDSVLKASKKREVLYSKGITKGITYFFCGDASSLGLKDESVSVVFGHGVLHHIKKYSGIGEELFRVLKKGGVAVFAENLGENKILEAIRRKIWEKKGLVGIEDTLKYGDIKNIGRKFSDIMVVELSLLSTVKRFFGYKNFFIIRPFIYMLYVLDEVILRIFPFLRRYCAESVIIFKK